MCVCVSILHPQLCFMNSLQCEFMVDWGVLNYFHPSLIKFRPSNLCKLSDKLHFKQKYGCKTWHMEELYFAQHKTSKKLVIFWASMYCFCFHWILFSKSILDKFEGIEVWPFKLKANSLWHFKWICPTKCLNRNPEITIKKKLDGNCKLKTWRLNFSCHFLC